MKEIIQKIRKQLKNRIFSLTGKAFFNPIEKYNFHNLSFSQEGENMILRRIFEGQETGFYVDVGAHHPQRFSNTYLFYLKGWRGINIDAMPGSMKIFNELRPNDINIEVGIADSNKELIYYEFNESALNGFSEELSRQRDGIREEYFIVGTQRIKTLKYQKFWINIFRRIRKLTS